MKRYTVLTLLVFCTLCQMGCKATKTKIAPTPAPLSCVEQIRWGLKEDWADTVIVLAEKYFRTASDTAPEREEVASCLKWALVKKAQLCNRFLSYGSIAEMGLMFPLPDSLQKTKPILSIVCTDMGACIAPIPNFAQGRGLQKRRNILEQVYLSVLPPEKLNYWEKKERKEKEFAKMQGRDTDSAQTNYLIDTWLSVLYPMDARERAHLHLDTAQQRSWLDFYTLSNLLLKDFDRLDFIISEYERLGVKTLPNYVQEALLLRMGYMQPNGPLREQILQMKFGGTSIREDILNVFEAWFFAYLQVERGVLSPADVRANLGSTYLYYFIWDGLSVANQTSNRL